MRSASPESTERTDWPPAPKVESEAGFTTRLADLVDYRLAFGALPHVHDRIGDGAWLGLTIDRDAMPVAVCAIAWDRHGRAWGHYRQLAPVPPRLSARVIRRTTEALLAGCSQALHVLPDTSVMTARHRLRRFRFQPERDADLDREIWVRRWNETSEASCPA